MVSHLYLHIPFCAKICPYCSFYKEAMDPKKIQAFLEAILLEAKQFSNQLQPTTVFFGGGTPSILSVKQLDFLLQGLHETLDFSQLQEWTFEMNPATVSLEKAQLLKSLGVNRISMGVQAWDETSLHILGRVHTADQARKSYDILRKAGFDNVNLDLIFGVPDQSLDQWKDNLKITAALDPNHISAYCLTYEEDTAFFERWRRGELGPDEERDTVLFESTMEILESRGYSQYEISNYSKFGHECRHNLAYWQGCDFIGLGPSAVSTVDHTRWNNVRDTADYIQRITKHQTAAIEVETITAAIHYRERLAFGLRMRDGIKASEFAISKRKAKALQDHGYLVKQENHWKLTRKGLLLADGIASELWEEE